MSTTCQWVTRGLMRPILCIARPFLAAETIAAVGLQQPLAVVAGPSTGGHADDASSAFASAASAVSACTDLPVALRLRLYALYKQATTGDAAASPQSSVFDAASQLKWRAWAEVASALSALHAAGTRNRPTAADCTRARQVRGMPRDEAMRLYVSVAEAAMGGGADNLAVDGLAGLEDAEDAEEEALIAPLE